MENVKGMFAEVYRNGDNYDCTMGGFSSTHNRVLLVGPNVPKIFSPYENTPIVEIVEFDFRGETSLRIKEVGKPCGMFGGNFLYSSDSRFPSKSPIKIFDRFEK